MSEQQDAPEQRAVEHMRQLTRPTMAWCGAPMPDRTLVGVVTTCVPCLAAAQAYLNQSRRGGTYPP